MRNQPTDRQPRKHNIRNGATQTTTATVESQKLKSIESLKEVFPPGGFEMPEIHIPDMPQVFTSWRSMALGVEAESLGSQLAEYFGVKEGVLVRAVVKGSAAEKAGIKAGDVITKVDQTKIATPNELSSAVRTAPAQKTFPVELVRDRHQTSLTVTVDDSRSDGSVPRVKVVRGSTGRL